MRRTSMKTCDIAVIEYGLGNIFSIKHACEHFGLRAEVTSDKAVIAAAKAVILPGVGAFGDAMKALRSLDLVAPLKDFAASGKPLVGICLGQQLLFSRSHEFGLHEGLGFIEGDVIRFDAPRLNGKELKVPHVSWCAVHAPGSDAADGESPSQWDGTLLQGVNQGDEMYFVHSFYTVPKDASVATTLSRYGETEFCSGVKKGNVAGFQFHPERSGEVGMKVYHNLAKQLKQ